MANSMTLTASFGHFFHSAMLIYLMESPVRTVSPGYSNWSERGWHFVLCQRHMPKTAQLATDPLLG